MTSPEDRLVRMLAERVWLLEGLDPASLSIEPHWHAPTGPSCTVRVGETGQALAVRLPMDWETGRASNRRPGLISRVVPDEPTADREAENLERVTPLGLAPATVQFDPDDGLWVFPLWDGVVADARALRTDPGLLGRVAWSLRLLHISGLDFRGHCHPLDALDPATVWTQESAVGMPLKTLHMVTDIVGQCREVLTSVPTRPVPCLNAAATEACFDTGSRTVFLDWRASCMGDPHFELAGMAARAGLNAEEVGAFLTAYFGTSEQSLERDRVVAYRLIAAYLRLTDLHGALMAGLADPAAEIHRRRFAARLEACVMILESASWTAAMDRLSAVRRDTDRTQGAALTPSPDPAA